ncbi:MAG: class I SAM-dependent methyltransferase [Erysipelotrichaceae bacterium]|nr:class I SAM-dependent methyltransferase [Erysipelotrichaceae bacterium]
MNNETIKKQYGTADKLDIRISFHNKYSVNKQGFGNWIFSNYQISEGMSVLELGCGNGRMWLGEDEIINRCSRLILSDVSESMLKSAEDNLKNYSGIEYCVIDIENIPFPDKEFDIVIANMMLYHVSDLSKGLEEVKRVLKDDGTFYCATYGENGMMEHIVLMFDDFPISSVYNYNFTLQNGESKLLRYFKDIQKLQYEDALEITDIDDLVDYIYSLPSFSDIQDYDRDTLKDVLIKNMHNGILHVPKDYGMFIARKQIFRYL